MKVWPKKITRVGQFLDEVAKITETWKGPNGELPAPWFRGQEDGRYGLLPGTYRGKVPVDEDSLRHDFAMKAFPYLSETTSPLVDNWDRYFVMQHYGLPTRLLDWSEGSLVALYFALRKVEDGVNPAVWVLDPWKINHILAGLGDMICASTDKRVKSYLPAPWETNDFPEKPAAIQAPLNSKRITAQRGVFTIHGSSTKGIEEFPELEDALVKINIDYMEAAIMFDHLVMAGITESVLFPDLEGLCRELKRYWNNG